MRILAAVPLIERKDGDSEIHLGNLSNRTWPPKKKDGVKMLAPAKEGAELHAAAK